MSAATIAFLVGGAALCAFGVLLLVRALTPSRGPCRRCGHDTRYRIRVVGGWQWCCNQRLCLLPQGQPPRPRMDDQTRVDLTGVTVPPWYWAEPPGRV